MEHLTVPQMHYVICCRLCSPAPQIISDLSPAQFVL